MGERDRVPSKLTVDQHAELLKARAKRFGVTMTNEQAKRAAEILVRKERVIGRPGPKKTKNITK